METKKIKFIGYYPGFEPCLSREYNLLKKYYDVEISNNPDYIFYSCFETAYEYVNYDAIRIFYSAENYAPNFNCADYAIGFNFIQAEDRYFRYPVSLYTPTIQKASEKHIDIDEKQMQKRKFFCNFIYGNSKGQSEREELFHKLNQYKRVESAGTFLNNQEDGWYAKNAEEKLSFLENCKFTIAVDSVQLRGFSTEKITHAFATKTIPIYLGDPTIGKIFNEKAFINGNNYLSVDEIVQRVIEIDNDEELYFSMLREPIFLNPNFLNEFESEYEKFILNIFNQDIKKATRRSKEFFGAYDDNHLKIINKLSKSKMLQIINAAYFKILGRL